ncbi:MAG: hypothetical protein ACOCQ3_03125 [Natronomonas sp.]
MTPRQSAAAGSWITAVGFDRSTCSPLTHRVESREFTFLPE